jgi:N utilization substance protein B
MRPSRCQTLPGPPEVTEARESSGTNAVTSDLHAAGVHGPEREGRQLALAAVFEAEFGQRTAGTILARRLDEGDIGQRAAAHARRVVDVVVAHRDSIDARIEAVAPAYPVVQLARIDRALLRCGMGELLHCRTTPTKVAISEWVELARIYSGEPTRRLMNGALGRVAKDVTEAQRDETPSGPQGEIETEAAGHTEGPAE